MFIAHTNKHLFFSSGKIGTRTILTIPDIIRIHPPGDWNYDKIKKRVLRSAIECLSQNNHLRPVVIVRDPVDRYHSGLFEIIGKVVIETWLRTFISDGTDVDEIQKNLKIFKSNEFWTNTFYHFYSLAPEFWVRQQEIQNIRWHFHVGNWLDSAVYLKNEFDATVIDIKQLTSFMHNNGYKPKREVDNAFLEFSSIVDEYHPPYNTIKIPTAEIFSAFKTAHLTLPVKWSKRIEKYLEPEIDLYNSLINQQN